MYSSNLFSIFIILFISIQFAIFSTLISISDCLVQICNYIRKMLKQIIKLNSLKSLSVVPRLSYSSATGKKKPPSWRRCSTHLNSSLSWRLTMVWVRRLSRRLASKVCNKTVGLTELYLCKRNKDLICCLTVYWIVNCL